MTEEEYLSLKSNIEIYCDILLGVLRYTPVRNYQSEEDYKRILNRNLKFENNDDHHRLRACIDLTEDTQYAISEFYKNGLITKSEGQGEMYLRLYGVLNAVYLQMQSTIELIELFKVPNKKKISTALKALKVIDVRNKLAAHTPNYTNDINQGKSKTESYRLTQTSITKWGDQLMIVSSYDQIEEFQLVPLMKIFTERIEYYLDIISEKGLKLFPNKSEQKEWMVNRLNFVRKRKTW
ncbi:hypothetical protein [Arenibacter algicola]|jgi:hypothetical protein|uniref:Uncharacterized protein n=1 Tax=Arenibacter algicola TaxID=616991 RepID=A0A221UW50_9FLAO|nr:hypothetical protein [Arenibacter algicola]ASO05326.1 hypothetical protein AREALGSMS7_01862 [Arenibacter algicola]HCO83384.1 hypothetical protein [Arenibacter sp.]|tara:strand:+ start:787 stop:1497 length:711 start_codon:yes stop_codon:yes gene_type:complete